MSAHSFLGTQHGMLRNGGLVGVVSACGGLTEGA